METRTVVIVGAGFSGIAVAISLLRLPQPQPLRVVLIERKRRAGGVAYAPAPFPYLLNVPAGRMSASSLDPREFLDFAQRTHPAATEHDFLPRSLYGQYLESSLLGAARAAPPEVRLERLHAEVIALERPLRGSTVDVHLDNGWKMTADSVVLAAGNPPPGALPGSDKLTPAQYLREPWSAPAAVRSGDTVLVAGTGLTMADVVLAAAESTRGAVELHAISRHGLLPASQTNFPQSDDGPDSAPLLRAASVSLSHLVRAVRALATEQDLQAGDWRETITLVRKLAPALWQRLAPRERQRFLRHVRPYWDVHRHRLPAETWSAINGLRRSGALHVRPGRILDLEPVRGRVRVTWRPRGEERAVSFLVDRVVNCTGPDYGARRSREPLLRSLIAQGIAVPDPLDLGLQTAEFGALVDASGRAARNIYYIGPMLRAKYWESTAVQELRAHAEALARHLAAPVNPVWRPGWQDRRWAPASPAGRLAASP
jgi:uncharacterized NAD(P)/FAD-binding protein YdhS